MDPAALAALLRDYGPWGLLALSLLANRMLLGWWRDCMTARIDERGTLATTIERQAASNAEALSFTLAQAEVEALDRATTAD